MARLGIFEADREWREIYDEMAAEEGHEIVVRATNYNGAKVAIESLNEGDIQAALIGSRLEGPHSGSGDGVIIAELLHRIPGVIVIAVTGDPGGIEGADVTVQKNPEGVFVDPMMVVAATLGALVPKD